MEKVYRYTYTLGAFRDGEGSESEYVFTAKNDEEARDKVREFLKPMMQNCFLVKGKLEKGKLVSKKIKVFKPAVIVAIDGVQVVKLESNRNQPIEVAMKIGKDGKPFGLEIRDK